MIFLDSLVSFPREQESDDGEILLVEECIVTVYIGAKIAEFFGHLTFIKSDKIADVEKIPVPVEIANLGGNLHEEKELAVDTAVDLEDIVHAGDIGYYSNLVEMSEFQKDIVIWSIFTHHLDKCRNFVDFFPVECDDFLLLGINFLSENQYLENNHKKDQNEY